MKKKAFEPFGSKGAVHSSHSTTCSNREHLLAKTGLELALVKLDTVRRTAKYRALKKFHESETYLKMSDKEKKAMKEHTIREHGEEWETKREKEIEHWEAAE